MLGKGNASFSLQKLVKNFLFIHFSEEVTFKLHEKCTSFYPGFEVILKSFYNIVMHICQHQKITDLFGFLRYAAIIVSEEIIYKIL